MKWRRGTLAHLLLITLLVFGAFVSQSAAAQQGTRLSLAAIKLRLGPGPGSCIFAYEITPLNRSGFVGVQLVMQRTAPDGAVKWDTATVETESGPLILDLKKGQPSTGSFTVPLSKGVFGSCRILFFHSVDGKNVDWTRNVYDSANDSSLSKFKLGFTNLAPKRIVVPEVSISGEPEIKPSAGALYGFSVEGEIRLPKDYGTSGAGLWLVSRSPLGIRRTLVSLSGAVPSGADEDEFNRVPVKLAFESAPAGLWSIEVGIARSSTPQDIKWNLDHLEFEVGGGDWLKPYSGKLLPRLRVRHGRFETLNGLPYDFYPEQPSARSAVPFVRGGNYGNAICWTVTPANNRPEYFRLLYNLGCRFIRLNFSADRYLDKPYYPRAVEQTVQNIWSAGLYPILAPQELPKATTIQLGTDRLSLMWAQVASKYRGKPVWYNVLNEPAQFPTWPEWRPVALRMARTIRAADPDSLVIIPFEGWATDGRAASKDPITELPVDIYDGHAYVSPTELNLRFGPPIRSGLPVMIGEVGGGAVYLEKMMLALQAMPAPPIAMAPWAFTVPGQDSIPLIEDVTSSGLKYTPAGVSVETAFAAWNAGRKLGK